MSPVPAPASAKPPAPVPTAAALRRRVAKLICDAYSLGFAPSKFTCEQKGGGNAVRKRRPGSRYLSVVVALDGIQMREVGICDARVKSGAGVRTLPSNASSGSLLRRRAVWRNFSQVDPGQPRPSAATAVLGET